MLVYQRVEDHLNLQVFRVSDSEFVASLLARNLQSMVRYAFGIAHKKHHFVKRIAPADRKDQGTSKEQVGQWLYDASDY